MSQAFRASLEWRSPSLITPYHRNNKAHPDEAVEKLADHIQQYGWDVPIVIDESGVVIKGHRRRLAAIHLGLKEVPCIVRADLSEEQLAAARLADNRLNDDSPYDEGAIAEELAWLQDQGITLSETAFSAEEIDFLLDSLNNLAIQGGEGAEFLPEFQGEEQQTTHLPRHEPEEEEEEEPPKRQPGGNYPLPIVVGWDDRQRWQDIKEAIGIKKDPQAFLRLLHLAELVQGEHPDTWRAVCQLKR